LTSGEAEREILLQLSESIRSGEEEVVVVEEGRDRRGWKDGGGG